MARYQQRIRLGTRKGLMAGAILTLALGTACSDDSASTGGSAVQPDPKPTAPTPAPAPPPVEPVVDTRTPEELIEAGRSVYNANCIACHGIDPTKDGALGPAVSGASLELLEARVLRAVYPEGYVPKRTSRVMVALPHLETKIPELAVYLESLD